MIATLVVSMLFLVLSSVELDDKFRAKARKVNDIAPDRHLPPESEPGQLPKP
jgi:hypothetical protein